MTSQLRGHGISVGSVPLELQVVTVYVELVEARVGVSAAAQ